VGVVIRLRRAAPIVDHPLDGGAVELLQREQRPLARALAIKRRRVDDEHVFKQRAQPGLPARHAVGFLEKILDTRDARADVGIDRGALAPFHAGPPDHYVRFSSLLGLSASQSGRLMQLHSTSDFRPL